MELISLVELIQSERMSPDAKATTSLVFPFRSTTRFQESSVSQSSRTRFGKVKRHFLKCHQASILHVPWAPFFGVPTEATAEKADTTLRVDLSCWDRNGLQRSLSSEWNDSSSESHAGNIHAKTNAAALRRQLAATSKCRTVTENKNGTNTQNLGRSFAVHA